MIKFSTIEKIESNEDEFSALNPNEKKMIFRKLIRELVKKIPDVVAPNDTQTEDVIVFWLVDKELFEDHELLSNIKDLN